MTDRTSARRALRVLRARVDEHFAGAMNRSPGALQCARGCSECCHRRFSVFELEASDLRRALAELSRTDPPLRDRIRQQAADPEGPCPLLVDGSCSVYPVRPLICRSHGLPVATDEGQVDWCRLNFRDRDIPRASVLDLQAVNAPLAVASALADAGAPRVALADLAKSD